MPAVAQTSDWPNLHAAEVRKLATLLEISQALLAAREFQPGLVKVLETLGAHHGAIRSSVVLLNERSGEVSVKASAGIPDGSAVRYKLGEGITGEVVQSGKPMIVPQVSREPRFLPRAGARPEVADRELTCICVPIAIDGATIGALGIDLVYNSHRDYERTTKFLGVVGSMIAQAMKVHQLIEADRQVLVDENTHLRLELKERYGFTNIVGTSGAMQEVYEQISQVAPTNTTVLLRG